MTDQARAWRCEEKLRRLYVEQGMSTVKIADRFGCTNGTISRWLRKHGIETRGGETSGTENYAICHSCATVFPCPPSRVKRSESVYCSEDCHRMGQTGSANPRTPDQLKNKKKLEWMYAEKDLSGRKIAEVLDCDPKTVYNALRRHGLKVDSSGRSPKNTGSWTANYGPNWTEQRERALKRDGWSCQRCGIGQKESKEQYDTGLSVHHIKRLSWYKNEYDDPDWWKKANKLCNLVTLCNECHGVWEGIPLRPDTRAVTS